MRPLVATYRLQLGPDLTFAHAAHLVPYLRDLGVSHLYLSPIMQARRGSTHGYDVIDPRRVSDVLGGEQGLRALASAGLELLVDIVPNHMAVSDENPFWADPELRRQFFDLDPRGGHRRFFDIDELAGVRMEDPEVFAVTHAKLVELVCDGVVAGVRVDHIDGLADPLGYLVRLRDAGVEHVWVEKILAPGEELPPWPVEGSTGYDFLADVDALFVDPDGRAALDAAADRRRSFHELAHEAKAEQVRTTFSAELARLQRVADVDQLAAGLAALPVYRTYVDPTTRAASEQDRAAIARVPEPVARAVLEPDVAPPEFVVRFQQTTGAVTAKGVEDTAMYRDVRLLALNEVGADPDRFGTPIADFHRANQRRAVAWPRALLTATTHDTKRSADVRARILVLSTRAREWGDLVSWWRDLCRDHGAGTRGPDPVEQVYVLQTLVGAWPVAPARLETHLVKAMREAKRQTSWIAPDEEHERAVVGVVQDAVDDPCFLARFAPFLQRVVPAAERIALGALVLRCTLPGVPDVYQGDELWNHLLVDPDNRRSVDWELRRSLLDPAPPDRVDRFTAKLFALRALLALRAAHRGFEELDYQPLRAPDGVCAFARGARPRVVVVVPVQPVTACCAVDQLDVAQGDDDGEWTDVLAPLDAVYGERRPSVYARGLSSH